ncbi:hypothetical protein ABE29_17285 [Cytobacillus firmus]|uniref:Uncharacterized protein n=1 Tax=Cytobacillus firmus TaxID=1399 RepID=A0A380XBX1_CYTFI|nr:DUF5316 family protein [Cytobacillus firmus]KAF0822995.1 hypothetical protein KIS1582_3239 [Cytobacillus firmus]MBG9544463.1 hypothetical protein [Cytobacillus firmus]MBG9551493.1 hypothetical protein [Cytobacillus firmus]MBG9555332.1 hypothetical protein [Cytobacillus firmus]MBG9573845.1 hypothetical protein [Cytobacillus firmus]
MKHLTLGIVLAIAGVLFSIGFWEFSKAYLVTGAIGFLFIAVSILMSGSIAGPHRMRAGLEAHDFLEEKRKRKRTSIGSVLIGLPNIMIALLLYLFLN